MYSCTVVLPAIVNKYTCAPSIGVNPNMVKMCHMVQNDENNHCINLIETMYSIKAEDNNPSLIIKKLNLYTQ